MTNLNHFILFMVNCLVGGTPQNFEFSEGYHYNKPTHPFNEPGLNNSYLPPVSNHFPQSPLPIGQPTSQFRSSSLPVSPFPATTSNQQSCESYHRQFDNNYNCCGSPRQFCESNGNDNGLEDHEMPPNSVNGLIMGKGTYTFVGKDGITRAVDGDLMFKSSGKKTRKLGIPSAAVASLAGGGLG